MHFFIEFLIPNSRILTWNTPSPHLIGCEMGEKKIQYLTCNGRDGGGSTFSVSCFMYDKKTGGGVASSFNTTPPLLQTEKRRMLLLRISSYFPWSSFTITY